MYQSILIPLKPPLRFPDEVKNDKDMDNVLEKIHTPIICSLSELIRDSWRITEKRIVRLKSNKVELANKESELTLKLHLYKHVLRDEHNKVRNKDEEIRWNKQRILSREYQLSEIKKELCTINAIFVNTVVQCKKLHTQSTNLHSKLRSLNDETERLRCIKNDQNISTSTISQTFVDQILEAWVLSACVKEELKGQIMELEVKVHNLESQSSRLGQDADDQLRSLLGHWRNFSTLRSEFDELKSHNRKFEKDNVGLQSKVKKVFEANTELQEIHDELAYNLKKENEKNRVLDDVLTNTEFHKKMAMEELKMHQNNVDCLKKHRNQRKIISEFNVMNVLMFLLGFDYQFNRI